MIAFKRIAILMLVVMARAGAAFSQNPTSIDLLNQLNDSIVEQAAEMDGVNSIFKATQIVNLPTVEQPGRNNLQFIIMHRFGKLDGGLYQLFGLDNATIRFGLDYGLTDRLSIGIGRSSLDKTYDGSFKYKLLQQREHKMPVAVSLNEWATVQTVKYDDKPYLNARYRTAYTSQLLIARKFNRNLSLEIVPTWVHYNLVPTPEDQDDIFLLGLAGRMKLTKRLSLDLEYDLLAGNPMPSRDIKPSLGVGLDIETGGHVFQFVFSNSQGMIGPYYLTETNGTWGNGDIYFGFNISRAFGWKKAKVK